MAKPRFTNRQKEILKELERLSKKVGLRVSYGKLRFAGLKLKPGQCLLRGEKWIVMDRAQPFEEQVDVYREALKEFKIKKQDVPEILVKVLGLQQSLYSSEDVPDHQRQMI